MRILYLDTPLDPPGGEQFSLFYLIKNLDKQKFQTKVFIPNHCQFFELLKKENIDCKIVPLTKLFFEIKSFCPQIIHCNSATTKYSFISALAAILLKIPFLWHNRVTETAKLKEKIVAKLATKIVVISDVVKEKFKSFENKIVKVYNAVDTEIFKPGLNVEYLHKEFGIYKNDKVIGIFSRLDWWKGHRLLLEAIKKICSLPLTTSDLRVLIVGDGPEKKNLELFVADALASVRLKDKIIFTGFRQDIPYLMNLCDIIVNPSTEPEPFGRTVIEAMACGKLVIATNLGGHSEIISDGIDGFLVEPQPQKIVDVILKIFNDNSCVKKIGENAIKKVREKFSIKTQIEEIKQIYTQLI